MPRPQSLRAESTRVHGSVMEIFDYTKSEALIVYVNYTLRTIQTVSEVCNYNNNVPDKEFPYYYAL